MQHSHDGADANGTIKANGTGNTLSILQNPANGVALSQTKRPNHLKISREDVLSVAELGASWTAVSVEVCCWYAVHCERDVGVCGRCIPIHSLHLCSRVKFTHFLVGGGGLLT